MNVTQPQDKVIFCPHLYATHESDLFFIRVMHPHNNLKSRIRSATLNIFRLITLSSRALVVLRERRVYDNV